jgi:hypothetical protein
LSSAAIKCTRGHIVSDSEDNDDEDDDEDDEDEEEEEEEMGKLMILRSTTLSLMASCWSAAIK